MTDGREILIYLMLSVLKKTQKLGCIFLLIFQANAICSNGAVWEEIIWNNELVKYAKIDTILISIQNMKPAKKF